MNIDETKILLAELPTGYVHFVRLESDGLNAALLFDLSFEEEVFHVGFRFGEL